MLPVIDWVPVVLITVESTAKVPVVVIVPPVIPEPEATEVTPLDWTGLGKLTESQTVLQACHVPEFLPLTAISPVLKLLNIWETQDELYAATKSPPSE